MTRRSSHVSLHPTTMVEQPNSASSLVEIARMIDEGGPVAATHSLMTRRGTTSGSARRTGRAVTGQGLSYELPSEAEALWRDLSRTSGGRAAKTLVKADNLRVVLIAIRAGTTLDPHAIAGAASVHVLSGRVAVQVQGRTRPVGSGTFVVLSDNLHEPIAAVEDVLLLATVAWPDRAGAWTLDTAPGRQ